ncbi:MAG: aryl-sulfate sulfotransferase, partial [Flavobacteriales bacterium]|nr:aryl-sulfate sulfotransferase [Flavobacteriales bacterium]
MKRTLQFIALALTVGLGQSYAQTAFDGYALYNKLNNNTAYLIDKDGDIVHTWSCAESCNYAVKLKDNGNILRGASYSGNILTGAAIGGMIQELDASANVVWEYIYSDADHCSHHDFCPLPNGNVILVAWEVKTTTECTQAGVDGVSVDQWPTHFVELQPDGSGGASIVWEWHIWDHMVQDFDNAKDNFGVVADHPELMDI